MASITKTTGNFTLTSTYTRSVSVGSYSMLAIVQYSTPTTASTTRTIDISTIPDGAVVESATLSYRTNGAGESKAVCGGITKTITNSGTRDVSDWFSGKTAFGSITIKFTFQAYKPASEQINLGSNPVPAAGTVSKSCSFGTQTLTINYSIPYTEITGATSFDVTPKIVAPSGALNFSWVQGLDGSGNAIASYRILQSGTEIATIPPSESTYTGTAPSKTGVYQYSLRTVASVSGAKSFTTNSVDVTVDIPATYTTIGSVRVSRVNGETGVQDDEGTTILVEGTLNLSDQSAVPRECRISIWDKELGREEDAASITIPDFSTSYSVANKISYIISAADSTGSFAAFLKDKIADIQPSHGYMIKIDLSEDANGSLPRKTSFITEAPSPIYALHFCESTVNGVVHIGGAFGKRSTETDVLDSVWQYKVNGKPLVLDVVVTVPTNGWTAHGDFQKVTIPAEGILTTDNPIAGLVHGTDSTAWDDEDAAWALVREITTADGAIAVYADDVPETEITIRLKEVRA